MEGVCFHNNRKDLQTNEEFCNSILQYLHLESERYLKKERKALSDCKINNSVTKMKEEKVVDLYNVFSRASNNWKNSDGKLRRTCSYPTISEGETLNTVVETSPESSEELLYFRRPGEGFEDDLEEVDSNEDIEENSSESCDTKKPQNAEISDNQEKAKPVIEGDPNKHCGTWNKIDQSSLKVNGFRRKWSREKSQSSRELCQQKERNPGANSKIKLETVAQVVEARPRSHHFLWTIPDPGSQKLNWHKPPLTVLVVKKIYDESVLEPFKGLISWLIETRKMIVYVESNVLKEDILEEDSIFKKYRDRLQTFKDAKDDLTDKIDFIICLGGDGTLLHASSLFQQSCPPVMAFHQGSLGFLTPFSFDNFETQVTSVLEGNASLLLRYRLKCVICKEDSELGRVTRIKHIDRSSPCGNSQILVLNEVVVDRGSSSYICNIDLYVEGRHVTSVQGDGLIISTPTGSTAYAVAAGASMIHPNVPAIMITPICPHSLSFRPIVVPAGVELKIMLSPEARGGAMVSFDGRNRQEIFQGDSVRITTAQFPLPAVCAKDQIDDWFDRLAECLHWNVRKPQKMLSVSSTNSEHSTNSMTNSQNNSTDSIEDGAT